MSPDAAEMSEEQHRISPHNDVLVFSFSQCDCTMFFQYRVETNIITLDAVKLRSRM